MNAIVSTVEIHQSGVSRHLRILRESGFVEVRADGQQRLYSLRPEPFRELDAWVTRYREPLGRRASTTSPASSTDEQKARASNDQEGKS